MTTNLLNELRTNKTIDELTKAEVNELAVLAQTSEEAMWLLKAHYTPTIEMLRERHWHHMNNDTHFVNDAENRIQHAVKNYNPELGNFDARITRLFKQSIAKYCGKRGQLRKNIEMLDGMVANNADDNSEGDIGTVLYAETQMLQKSTEEIVTEEADIEELKSIYCKKDTDEIIVDIITKHNTYGGLTHYDIARRLADITGKSFHSARSVLKTFIKNRKAEVAF
ncbi:hypothetical protein [Bacillus mycoides]|uniref:Uncharacterized protein n=1 Tax=Bacillus mycoides (strain KBAB4) TaxID=315730 RepID=A9VVJ0_BACMK|nr:hypothetical protein [Bacillus mycoides]ABY46805.1 hypothetical protein BcerKBAB4_5311 [Bacillus mycoides KBAB4]